MRVTISRRDTADTAITAELLFSLHTQSSSLTPGPGSEVGCNCSDTLPLGSVIGGNCSDTLVAGVVYIIIGRWWMMNCCIKT